MPGELPPLRIAIMLESDGPGGAEVMVLQLSEELRRRGHVVVPVGPERGIGWLGDRFRASGFEPETFRLDRAVDPGCARRLAELFRRRAIDVVHSHEFTMAVYGAAAARAVRRPHIITFHGGLQMLARWRRRVALRWAIRRSRATVAVSESTRRIFAGRLGIPEAGFTVVPNGIAVRTGARESVRAELSLAEDELLIVAVGNVIPVKGHLTLVQALSRLPATGPRWRLAIAGDLREAAPPIQEFATSAGLARQVVLLGRRLDVPDLLAAADVFAMPSLSEGLPLALLEAMFAGRAIVASNVGGIPEVIRDGVQGLLVPPGDAAALAAALARLLGDPGERTRLGSAAQALGYRQFTVATMTDAYETLYRLS